MKNTNFYTGSRRWSSIPASSLISWRRSSVSKATKVGIGCIAGNAGNAGFASNSDSAGFASNSDSASNAGNAVIASCGRRDDDHNMLCKLNSRSVNSYRKPLFFMSLPYKDLRYKTFPAVLGRQGIPSRIYSVTSIPSCNSAYHTKIEPVRRVVEVMTIRCTT